MSAREHCKVDLNGRDQGAFAGRAWGRKRNGSIASFGLGGFGHCRGGLKSPSDLSAQTEGSTPHSDGRQALRSVAEMAAIERLRLLRYPSSLESVEIPFCKCLVAPRVDLFLQREGERRESFHQPLRRFLCLRQPI
jgi:hypothetical protein